VVQAESWPGLAGRGGGLIRAEPKPRASVKPKRCKWCKGDFFPARPMQKVCSPACAHALTNAENAKKAAKAKALEAKQDRAKRIALKTIPELIAEAQHDFNRYVRLRDAGRGCISCGAHLPAGGVGGGFDCGHYRSRGAAGHLRFCEDNAHGQCKRCNRRLSGNVAAFRIGLAGRIGDERLAALEADNAPHKWTRTELIAIRDEYRAKARALVKPSPNSGAQLGACAI